MRQNDIVAMTLWIQFSSWGIGPDGDGVVIFGILCYERKGTGENSTSWLKKNRILEASAKVFAQLFSK